MPNNPNSIGSPSSALIQALTRILKPLVRLLIRHHITFPLISQILKSIYLQVADEETASDAKRSTDSRLSVLTGVHRKDVRRLRQENETIAMPEIKPTSLGAQVIAAWISDAEYTDKKGNALPLHRYATSGEPSFEQLVGDISRQDVKARSLLDEWLRAGIVELDENDKVILKTEAFIPEENFDEKVFFFGHGVHDHLAAGVENLAGKTPPHFDRSVYYNNLKPESVAELKAFIDEEAMNLIKQANKKARAMQKRDSGKEGAHYRFRFGAYFFSADTKSNPSEDVKHED